MAILTACYVSYHCIEYRILIEHKILSKKLVYFNNLKIVIYRAGSVAQVIDEFKPQYCPPPQKSNVC
jgi:hypothetical protein